MREHLNGMWRIPGIRGRQRTAAAVGVSLLLMLGLFGGTSQAATKPLPRGVVGIVPQTPLEQADLERMARSNVRTIRVPFIWYALAPEPPWRRQPDWSAYDALITRAAYEGINVVPFLYGTPGWVADDTRVEPVFSARARRGWAAFLRSAVQRYKPGGDFWFNHPEVPRFPIRIWQIWNEPNIASFSRFPSPPRYASLVRNSARAVHSVAPNAQIMLAGLFGRPLQAPNIQPDDFLRRVMKGTGVAQIADAIALHPYVPRARQIPLIVEALREVMRDAGRARIPLWITEMGWGSDSFESRWERGWRGQARELNTAMRLLSESRHRWHVRRIFWYSWVDAPACLFCDSAGLFTPQGRAKPSWYAFNAWTGGDPRLP